MTTTSSTAPAPATPPDEDVLSDGHLELGDGGWAGSRHWRGTVLWFLLTVTLGFGGIVALNCWVDPLGITGWGTYSRQSVEGASRTMKRTLLSDLKQPPQILLLGSSTGRNFSPDAIRSLSGQRAFNTSMSAGKPIDMFAMTSYAADLWPRRAFPHIVYLIDIDVTFRDTPPNAGLITTPELWRQFGLVDHARIAAGAYKPYTSLDTTKRTLHALKRGPVPRPQDADPLGAFDANGFRRRDPYARQDPTNRRESETRRYQKLVYAEGHGQRLEARGREYVRRIVELANRNGDTPTLVLLPVHPQYRSDMQEYGIEQRRRLVLAYLRKLASGGDARVADISNLKTFGGIDSDFSDHVHMTVPNATRALRWLQQHGYLAARKRR